MKVYDLRMCMKKDNPGKTISGWIIQWRGWGILCIFTHTSSCYSLNKNIEITWNGFCSSLIILVQVLKWINIFCVYNLFFSSSSESSDSSSEESEESEEEVTEEEEEEEVEEQVEDEKEEKGASRRGRGRSKRGTPSRKPTPVKKQTPAKTPARVM